MAISTIIRSTLLRISCCGTLFFVSACGDDSGASASTDGGTSSAASGGEWPGDPCALLTDTDFATLSTPVTISKTDPHNVGSAQFSPECHFYLKHADGTGSATMAVFVDKASDYALQKSIFHGVKVAGIGRDAWQGDADGQGNSTVGVLVDAWSFRVDSTYEYKYADLTILAKAVAPRLK